MQHTHIEIEGIPAVVWGAPSGRAVVAVHGNQSNKEDTPIAIFAELAAERGAQVLSFDLPGHGDRKGESAPCKVQNCVADLKRVWRYAQGNWGRLGLFGNSMGAYFSLLACRDEAVERAWFLSPVVDMRRVIENMMSWFQVTEAQLREQQTVPTPIGQDLYWDYYCYVKEHPIDKWDVPTSILYGEKDDLSELDRVTAFTERFSCGLKIVPGAEHYFHTPEQLQALREWLEETL